MSFADTRLAMGTVPKFLDLLHRARQFEAMLRHMDGAASSLAPFIASRGDRSSSGNGGRGLGKGNSGGSSSSQNGGGCTFTNSDNHGQQGGGQCQQFGYQSGSGGNSGNWNENL